jgi:hypothetical protein
MWRGSSHRYWHHRIWVRQALAGSSDVTACMHHVSPRRVVAWWHAHACTSTTVDAPAFATAVYQLQRRVGELFAAS